MPAAPACTRRRALRGEERSLRPPVRCCAASIAWAATGAQGACPNNVGAPAEIPAPNPAPDMKNPAAGFPDAGLPIRLPCQYIRGQGGAIGCAALLGAQILCSGLAVALVHHDVERDLLALIEGAQARALHGADMDEHVLL